jgi:hypothetical protein
MRIPFSYPLYKVYATRIGCKPNAEGKLVHTSQSETWAVLQAQKYKQDNKRVNVYIVREDTTHTVTLKI